MENPWKIDGYIHGKEFKIPAEVIFDGFPIPMENKWKRLKTHCSSYCVGIFRKYLFWGALQANPSYGLRSHPHRSLRNHQTLLMAGLPGKNQDPSNGKESEAAKFGPFKVRFYPFQCVIKCLYVTKVELPLSIFPDLSTIVLVDHWFIHLRSIAVPAETVHHTEARRSRMRYLGFVKWGGHLGLL